MFSYIYSAFLIIWDIFCCKIFMEAFAGRERKNKNVVKYLLFICLSILDYLIVILFADEFIWKEVCIILISSVIMWRYFQVSLRKSLILFLLFQGSALIVDYAAIMVLCQVFPFISEGLLQIAYVNILIAAIGKILLFCFVLMIKKNFGTKDADVLTNLEWIRFSLFPISTVVIIVAIIMNWDIGIDTNQAMILLCTALSLLVMNIVIFYLLSDVLKREIQIREDNLFKERVKNETDMYRSISENYDKQRKRAHEYKNQIDCIVELTKNGDYDELNKYLKILDNEIKASTDLIDTNNVIVNAILNSKYKEGREKGIAFVLQVNDLSDVKISDEDVVIILSNLLNNSIEACEKSLEKIIKFKFIKEKSYIVISVINTMKQVPNFIEGKYKTSKKDEEGEHGIGIENITNTVKKYGGSHLIDLIDGNFHFTILIPIR